MGKILIRNGTLIDGTGSDPLPGAALLLQDNKIADIGPEVAIRPQGEQFSELDARRGFILPGFIDAHVHLAMEGFDLQKFLLTPFSYNFYSCLENFRCTLMAGVTSVRDAGGVDLGMKKAVDEGLIVGPRVKISINALSITSGHGDSWFPSGVDLNPPIAYPGMPDGRCDGPDEVRKKVREMLRSGAEVIKICSTGGVGSPTDRPEFTQFSPEELSAIVSEAAYHGGVKVMSHAEGAEGIKTAVRAGVHSIEHGIFIDEEGIRLMLDKGTFLVPTLYALQAIFEQEKGGESIPPYVIAKAREVAGIHKEKIARAFQAGVKIAMGTDSGVGPHGHNLRELSLMCEIGMSPMQAVVATTKTAAECLEWQDKLGTLEKGKIADIVIWKTNPLEDIASLADNANAVVILKDGKVVKDLL
jgi:imidazolonepropionase-like amidohydrolase